MWVAQLSDLHLTAKNKRLFGEIDPWARLSAADKRLHQLSASVPDGLDAVVLSGDIANAGDREAYERLAEAIIDWSWPVMLLPGNHDDPAAMAAVFCKTSQRVLPTPVPPRWVCAQAEVLALGSWRLLFLNTACSGQSGGVARTDWLACLPDAGETPALLFQHHPPIVTGLAGMDAIRCRGEAELGSWLQAHPEVVALACGHVHRAVTGCFAGRPVVIAPALVHQMAFNVGGEASSLAWVDEPPALLLHRLARTDDGRPDWCAHGVLLEESLARAYPE